MNESLIVVLTPLVIALLKKLSTWAEQEIPARFLPLLAPAVGLVVDAVMRIAGLDSPGVAGAAMAGLAGVGLREAAVKATRIALD
jgi:hypothetical protein